MRAIRAQGMSIFEMKKTKRGVANQIIRPPTLALAINDGANRASGSLQFGSAHRERGSALWSSKPLGGKNAANARFASPRNLRFEDAQRMI